MGYGNFVAKNPITQCTKQMTKREKQRLIRFDLSRFARTICTAATPTVQLTRSCLILRVSVSTWTMRVHWSTYSAHFGFNGCNSLQMNRNVAFLFSFSLHSFSALGRFLILSICLGGQCWRRARESEEINAHICTFSRNTRTHTPF